MAHTLHTLSLSIVAVLTFSLTACGGGSSDNTTVTSTTKPEDTTKPTTPVTPPNNPTTPVTPTPKPNPDPGSSGNNNGSTLSCGDTVTQQAMITAINQARSKGRYCGKTFYPAAANLSWNGFLAKAAVDHADNMATQNFFSHTGKDGSTYKSRITDAGYPKNSSVGENIGAGQKTVSQVMTELLESPLHCENIMRAEIKDVGMACAYHPDSKYKYYWVQSFGLTATN